MPASQHEFLDRRHSENYGHMNRSNWKDLKTEVNLKLVDPGIHELVALLNEKGFTTYSSCSGGHRRDMRTRDGLSRHGEGYVAFSPPSRIVFKLYFALQKKRRPFDFTARVGITNEDQSIEQTVDSELRWQLKDHYRSRQRHYAGLFTDMVSIVRTLKPVKEKGQVLRATFGPETVKGQRVLDRQQTRFSR